MILTKMIAKTCATCRQPFETRNTTLAYCPTCARERTSAYMQAHREKRIEYLRQYHKNHRSERRAYERARKQRESEMQE